MKAKSDRFDAISDAEHQTTVHVKRAVAGEAESLEWIAERFTPLLHVQARRRLGPLSAQLDPQEVVQDVWAVTLPKLSDLNPREGRLTPVILKFLSTTLNHRVNQLLERKIRRKMMRLAEDADADLADPASAILTRVIRRESGSIVQRTLEELSPLDRDILVLRVMDQMENREAASLLGMAPGTVAVRFHRALRRLRERLPGSIFDELEEEGGGNKKSEDDR